MIAIKGGKIVTVTGKTYPQGVVLIDQNKIAGVGADLPVPQDAAVIDATGKWVTPGLIDAHTHISTNNKPGILNKDVDLNEYSSPITPQIRAVDALNPRDLAIAESRKAGFTTCCSLPGSTNVIGGTGIAFKLKEGKTVFDLMIPGTEQLKMALGENPKRYFGADKKAPVTRMAVSALLRETLYKAKIYEEQKRSPSPPAFDFMMESLLPAVRGERKVRVHCHRSDDIVTAVRIAEEFGLDVALEHVTEGYLIADFLAQKGVTCVVGPLNMDITKMEVWNITLKNPGILERAGVNLCLTQDTSWGTKLLPCYVGMCIARGLSEEGAFRAVTINPARLLGLGERTGSIETGKDADLAIWSGHPFSNFTICETTIIDGEVYQNPS